MNAAKQIQPSRRLPAVALIAAALLFAAQATVARASDLRLSIRDDVQLQVTPGAQLGTVEDRIGLAVGQKVPDFASQTYGGAPVTFHELLQEAPLLVVFYRGGWCAYCNVQVRQMTVAADEFAGRGVTPVLISVDRPEAASLAQKSYEIPFPVISDPDLAAHRAFNVVFRLDAETREKYKTYGIVLDEWSGRDHGSFAVASAFLVDASGQVLWSHASTDYKTRPSIAQLLQVLDEHAEQLRPPRSR